MCITLRIDFRISCIVRALYGLGFLFNHKSIVTITRLAFIGV